LWISKKLYLPEFGDVHVLPGIEEGDLGITPTGRAAKCTAKWGKVYIKCDKVYDSRERVGL
jgi:hypothetical protein